jgi:hypothetical protein
MQVPLEFCGFKDNLPKKIKTNRAYIINLDDEYDEDTDTYSEGTHWTCFQVMEYPNGKIEPFYFDSYGVPPPEIVKQRIMENFKMKLPYNTKDIQSMVSSMCGWACLAYLHFINVFDKRCGSLYWDTETFLSLFVDLNNTHDWKRNEYVIKMFFQPSDPSLRKPIDVIADPDAITDGDTDRIHDCGVEGATYNGMAKMAMEVKYR